MSYSMLSAVRRPLDIAYSTSCGHVSTGLATSEPHGMADIRPPEDEPRCPMIAESGGVLLPQQGDRARIDPACSARGFWFSAHNSPEARFGDF